MEEIEQLCSRVAILDKGKVIASGTKEEVKGMIALGEKIVVETFNINEDHLAKIREIPNVIDVELKENTLTIRQRNGTSNLVNIMSFIADHEISYGKIYSELPTLNDVFLEITGKELRD
ncbi:MAG: DUF4162 domain-containing protein [Bacillaceae bacterium]|nr:DUF4162 domain-containing protein [Bacillaceae bacterium]